MSRLPLFDVPEPVLDADGDARAFAVDPRNNVVLEASAGTGKTTVLVQRYVNLLKAGVEPSNILAITFTRKAATEMRERIIAELRKGARLSQLDRKRWDALRDRIGEISISTIDAFCLSLLREFPLEADLDPGFDMADETEVPRFIEEALDRSMRIFTARAKEDGDIALVLAQLGGARTRAGLATLLDRRLVACDALDRFFVHGSKDLHAADICARAASQLLDVLQHVRGGLDAFLRDGPSHHPRYQLFLRQVDRLQSGEPASNAQVRTMLDRIALHFLKQDGSARAGGAITPYKGSDYANEAAAKRHRTALFEIAPQVERILRQFARELNVVLARGIRRMFAIALSQYRATLEARAALDFADVLDRALGLLRRMDEFSQSRYRLESRYHHVLVDEFQDTSRAQWELVSLLIQSWGEGMGLASNPSIFIVGDRKQSIYRFRDAEVAVLHEAGRYIEGLRPASPSRRAISRSFRAVPELLDFVNEICEEMAGGAPVVNGFTYTDSDRFPAAPQQDHIRGPVLGLSVGETPEACAAAVAVEVERIIRDEVVRDKTTGVARAARPGDIAILFRSRTSHREFERELEKRAIPTYVYKGLGFFDADEIKDACALIRYLADPSSNLRAAALLRSGFVRLSDEALALLAPDLAGAILNGCPDDVSLNPEDASVLAHVRDRMPRWLELVDRVPPADLFERILPALAYAYEIRGPRQQQAWENLKKMRGLIRRIQNRGYATLARIADHVDALSAGDESNAVLEAIDAVNLMTVHASKGLEFPVVFVVNMARGATGFPKPVRVIVDGNGQEPSVSVSPFVSEMDAAEREREQHETRRLLYVAMTRARDRLYFSSALKEGQLKPGPGSLAEVLPASLKPIFQAAAMATENTLSWQGPSGRIVAWRICPPALDPAVSSLAHAGSSPDPAPLSSFDSRDADPQRTGDLRVSVTEWLARESSGALNVVSDNTSSALVGILVHRLFQFATRSGIHEVSRSTVLSLIRPEERVAAADIDLAVAASLDLWHRLRSRPEVVAATSDAEVFAEVPFSLRRIDPGGIVVLRGTIDCLAVSRDGAVTVIELKTGGFREEHQRQLELYVEATRSLFPDRSVRGLLVHA